MNDRAQLVSNVDAPDVSPDDRGAESVAFEKTPKQSSSPPDLHALVEDAMMQDRAAMETWRASPYNLR